MARSMFLKLVIFKAPDSLKLFGAFMNNIKCSDNMKS